ARRAAPYPRRETFASLRPLREAQAGDASHRRADGFGEGAYRGRSGEDSFDDVAEVVGEPEVAAVVAVGQLRVIEAQQVQDGRVQVVDVHLVLRRPGAELVGRAVNRP